MIDDVAGRNNKVWPVWGHDHAVRDLHAAAVRGPHHAYILSGFEHLGKSTLAEIFAQSLLCTQPSSPGVPCLDCRACRRVRRNTHPDCALWDLDRQVKTAEKRTTSRNLTLNIQTVRGITTSIAMRPLESRYRVVIVDDVETMQETAQEAFLKTLEEPPAYAVILLLTSDAELLLETIRSRAVKLQLQNVPIDRIRAGLLTQGVDPGRASLIAEASDGRPGWAIQAASDDKLLTERLELQAAADQWIEGERYYQLAEATRLGNAFGKDRDAVYARLVAVQRQWRQRVIDDLPVSQSALPDKVRALKSIDLCFKDLEANVRPKLALQTMVLQWPTINP
jgi:hypothetical protein